MGDSVTDTGGTRATVEYLARSVVAMGTEAVKATAYNADALERIETVVRKSSEAQVRAHVESTKEHVDALNRMAAALEVSGANSAALASAIRDTRPVQPSQEVADKLGTEKSKLLGALAMLLTALAIGYGGRAVMSPDTLSADQVAQIAVQAAQAVEAKR